MTERTTSAAAIMLLVRSEGVMTSRTDSKEI